jgi:heat shock protein HslJ
LSAGSIEANELTGTRWEWQQTEYDDDDMVAPNQTDDFTLTFLEDGRFLATTDCNNLIGGYEVDASSISFTQIAGTKMACPDIDSKETVFAKMLEETNGFIITEDGQLALTIKYDSGSIIFNPALTPATEVAPSDQEAHNNIIGMTVTEVEAYAEANKVIFRTGSIDGEGMALTMDFRPGRITAAIDNGVVTSYTVE